LIYWVCDLGFGVCISSLGVWIWRLEVCDLVIVIWSLDVGALWFDVFGLRNVDCDA